MRLPPPSLSLIQNANFILNSVRCKSEVKLLVRHFFHRWVLFQRIKTWQLEKKQCDFSQELNIKLQNSIIFPLAQCQSVWPQIIITGPHMFYQFIHNPHLTEINLYGEKFQPDIPYYFYVPSLRFSLKSTCWPYFYDRVGSFN